MYLNKRLQSRFGGRKQFPAEAERKRLMSKRKSNLQKLNEGRGQGIGPDYVPFYLANEGGSTGTASFIPDPIEGRQISVLSDTEKMMYWILRWNPNVEHIREQYPLDGKRINEVREKAGYNICSPEYVFTTDFFVDFKDGHQEAYSVKFSAQDFNPDNPKYLGNPNTYARLIERQNTERMYWESQGVAFNIVTRDDLVKFRIEIKNIEFVMGYWNPLFVETLEQKFMCLVAHRIINIPMEDELINPHKLVERQDKFYLNDLYESFLEYENQESELNYLKGGNSQ